MFERNTVSRSSDKTYVAATVELSDGRRLMGHFLIAPSMSLVDTLNEPEPFVEFQPFGGDREVMAKAAIRTLQQIDGKNRQSPPLLTADCEKSNPHEILELAKGASLTDVRNAFHKQLMKYNPDSYAQAGLPLEVTNYLDAMTRRVNAAYDVLCKEAVQVAPTDAPHGAEGARLELVR